MFTYIFFDSFSHQRIYTDWMEFMGLWCIINKTGFIINEYKQNMYLSICIWVYISNSYSMPHSG